MSIIRLTKNFSYVFLAKITTTLLATGAMIFLIRYLGPHQLGIYSYVTTIMGLIGIFADCGIGLQLVGQISKDKSLVQKCLINHVGIQVLISIFLFIGLLVFTYFEQHHLVRKLIMISSIGLFFSNLHIPFATVLNGLEDMKYSFYSSVFSGVTTFFIIFIGIYFSLNITFFILLTITPGLISFLVTFFYARKYLVFSLFSLQQVKSICLAGIPYFVLLTGAMIYAKVDIVMLKSLSSIADVGFYTATYKIIFLLNIIPTTLSGALYPMLSNYYHNNEDKVEYILIKLTKYLMIASVFISGIVYFYSFEIIYFLFGKAFVLSGITLQLLIISYIPCCMRVVISNYYLASERINMISLINLMGLVLNVVLNYYLIPTYSLYGAAFSTVLCELILLIIYLVIVLDKYPKFISDIGMIKVMSIAFLTVLCINYVDMFLFPIIAGVCWFIILYYLKIITRDEVAILISTIRHFQNKLKTNNC